MKGTCTDHGPTVTVPMDVWERLRRNASHVGLVGDQLIHMATELERLIAVIDEAQDQ